MVQHHRVKINWSGKLLVRGRTVFSWKWELVTLGLVPKPFSSRNRGGGAFWLNHNPDFVAHCGRGGPARLFFRLLAEPLANPRKCQSTLRKPLRIPRWRRI